MPPRALANGPRLLVSAALFAVVGCREELGPEAGPTTRVSGVVREGRRPVGGGWIEFYPVDGAVGNLRVGPIGRDGRFSVDGVAAGPNTIGFSRAPIAGPYRFNLRSFQSVMRRQIPAGRATTLDLDLAAEAAARPKPAEPAP